MHAVGTCSAVGHQGPVQADGRAGGRSFETLSRTCPVIPTAGRAGSHARGVLVGRAVTDKEKRIHSRWGASVESLYVGHDDGPIARS